MKKVAVLLIAGISIVVSAQAQINWGDYAQSYTEGANDDSPTVGLIVCLRKGNDFLWSIREKSQHFHTLEKDTLFRRLRPKQVLARTTFDTARAQFFLHGVGPQNAPLYQYRVTEYPSNRVVVPWHPINQFTDSTLIKSSRMPRIAYLGGYKTSFGNMLIVDVRKTGVGQIVGTSLVAWESIRPVVTSIYTSENFADFLKKLQYPWAPVKELSGQQAPVLKVPSTNSTVVFVLKGEIFYKEQIQYELIRNGSVYTAWRYNDYDNSFVWIRDCPPGSYVVKLRFSGQPLNVSEYRFDVEPAWYQTNLFRIVTGIFVAALLGAFLFMALFIRQRQKTQQEESNKTKLQLELKAIYAQLNPHFVFNALSSIQGLMNKQDIQGANNYLSDFARLMRESLANSNKEEVSLHEEIQGLDTYLKLERLRFGFTYQIIVDDAINRYNTSFPTLLLQPLVENAVKHGVSALGESGLITIYFDKTGDTMITRIIDNGKGFSAKAPTGGFGLTLTRDRIDLLNKLVSGQPIQFEVIPHAAEGTEIVLRFNHWFA